MKTKILTAVVSSFSLFFAPISFAQQGATEAQQEEERSPLEPGGPAATEPASPTATEPGAQPAEQESDQRETAQVDTRVSSKTIIGSTVKNTQGEELGQIEELMIDPRTGNIKEAVLSLGGGWVTEAKRVTLPWETLKVGLGVNEFTVEMDKAQLQNAPSGETTASSASGEPPASAAPADNP